MRRLISNSTALALSFAVAMPHLATAQTPVPDAEAKRLAAERASELPDMQKILAAELASGLKPDALTCVMNAPKPCVGPVAFTPKGVAVQLSDDGQLFLAEPDAQTREAQPDGTLTQRAGAKLSDASAAGAAPIVLAQASVEDGAEALKKKLQAVQDNGSKTVIDAAAKTEQAKPVEEKPTATPPEPAKAEAATENQPDVVKPADEKKPAEKAVSTEAAAAEKVLDPAATPATPEPSAASKPAAQSAPQPSEADLAKKLAEDQGKATEVAPAAEPKATEPKAAEPKTAEPKPAAAAPDAPELAKKLADEQAKADAAKAEPAKDGAAAAVATGAVEAPAEPSGTAAPATANAATADTAPANTLVAVPEAGAKVTDAAKQAANDVTPATAAALEADAKPQGQATETKVTAEDIRKSSQDYANAVTEAKAAEAKPEAKADEKKKGLSDLETVAIAGLAGLVAGKLLTDNREVALNTGDRVIVQNPDGSQQIIKDDNTLLFQPGSTVQTENFADGSSRTTVMRADGSKVVTIRDADYKVLRRSLVAADGTSTPLIDETRDVKPVQITELPPPARPVVISASQQMTETELRRALQAQSTINRSFTLGQIRSIPEVRALVAPVDIPAITFDTGSAAITPDQARSLAALGKTIADFVKENPREVFLIEGYTDTVGAAAMNLALSDRRAESVALALTEYFAVPPENMVVQGYGEQFLRLNREGDVRENRRVAVRRITELMQR